MLLNLYRFSLLFLQGFVYIKFGTPAVAAAAQKALHGRWFGQRTLCADFQFTPIFNAYFKL